MDEKIAALRRSIRDEALVTSDKQKIITPDGKEAEWLFDIRNILFKPDALNLIVDIFWEKFSSKYPFQVGGQEMAAIPLVSAIVLRSKQLGKPVNGFVIRKSRKPTGLQKIIEGEINSQKIILVDDLINSGSTIFRQIKIISDTGKRVDSVFSLINFRGMETIEKLGKEGIHLYSPFTLDDFGLHLTETENQETGRFNEIWHFKSISPGFFHRVPKSTPCIDGKNIFFGTDEGFFHCIRQDDGSAVWKYKVGYAVNGKSIFSSPAIHKNTVYFGAYDGDVYALNKDTGKLKWKYMDGDFVGSSPAIAPDLNLLFIGLEYGLFRKKGSIVALNLETGKKTWDHFLPEYVHCSPAYCPSKKVVAIGGNDSFVYLFNAKNGKLNWKSKVGGPVKASLAFCEKRNLLIFGSFDKNVYAMDIDTGELKGKFETLNLVYSTPKVHGGDILFSSMDKHVYSVNLDTGNLNWKFTTGGRIFSSPEVIDDMVVFGSNDGKMYELYPDSGKLSSSFQVTERITNKIVYNSSTKRYFLTTYANEVYCLEKIKKG